MSSFRSLPAEIRNRIYGLCSPFTGYIEDYNGLVLASKQTHVEYQAEAIRVVCQLLDNIEKIWPHPEAKLSIDRPSTLTELAHITVRLPRSLYYLPMTMSTARRIEDLKIHQKTNTRLDICLASLFSLHLSTLTFTYQKEDPTSVRRNYILIPSGLLLDLTSIFVDYRAPSLNIHMSDRENREFKLVEPVRIRRLIYRWFKERSNASTYNYQIDKENIQFFLTEEYWRQEANKQGLVTNWGRDSDSVHFDIRDYKS